mgnify:CR=1 FL=1
MNINIKQTHGKISQVFLSALGEFFLPKNAILALEDGQIFWGKSIGSTGETVGEVVFNTAMTGYQEILTDPSYSKQIVALTYPHIGNTGINIVDEESSGVYAAGLIIRDLPISHSNWRSEMSLEKYLSRNNIVAISNIDTRALTRHLRINGALKGCILAENNINSDQAIEKAKAFSGLKNMDLAKVVSTTKTYTFSQGSYDLERSDFRKATTKFKVAVYDYGVKKNILRMLVDRGCELTVFNAESPAEEVLDINPDGIFLSNGPGDPEPCDYAIDNIKKLLEKGLPIFGICLGHQLLSLASGAKTEKMKFGHHGANHPVQDLNSKNVMITSQNHGFTVSEENLPKNVEVTHRSLFDKTIQGVKIKGKSAFSFQGHPEASPGPHDIKMLFDQFINHMSQ